MKPLVAIGLILLVLGVATLGYQAVVGATTHDTLVKAGPMEVVAERQSVPVGTILATVGIVGGAALMIVGMSRRGPV